MLAMYSWGTNIAFQAISEGDDDKIKSSIELFRLIAIGTPHIFELVNFAGGSQRGTKEPKLTLKGDMYRKLMKEVRGARALSKQHRKRLQELKIPSTPRNIVISYLAEKNDVPLKKFKVKGEKLV
jgi:hypothetical protein